jgi:uncharacterized protein (TIGR03083 family)
MSHDYLASIPVNAERIADALAANPDGVMPWCGDWTVKDCAHHVGGLYHVVTQVIAGRPDVTFAAFGELNPPAVTDPGLGAWLREGAAAVHQQLAKTDPAEACWSFSRPDQNVGFWHRRIAQETLVHRWDSERAAGRPISPIEAELAADGVDEYLGVFVPRMRHVNKSPGAGEAAHLHCTDTAGEWLVLFTGPGTQDVRREHAKGDVAFRGPAHGLLLFLWGRLPAGEAGVEVIGDDAVAGRWRELVPPV